MIRKIVVLALALALPFPVEAAGPSTAPIRGAQDAPPLQKVCDFSLGPTIFARWQKLTAAGTVTCPVTSEADAVPSRLGTTGRWAQFLAGNFGAYIIVANSGPHAGVAYEVHGCFWSLYDRFGSTGGVFGFPISDERAVTGGRQSDFEGGYIRWDAKTSECTAHLKNSP